MTGSEQGGGEVPFQPGVQVRQWLRVEPLAVDRGELAHEGKDRGIGHAHRIAAKLIAVRPAVHRGQTGTPSRFPGDAAVSDPWRSGIFVPVKIVLERAIVARDQRGIVALRPAVGIARAQRPAHDVDAFVDDGAIVLHQHRHRPLGRGVQDASGFRAESLTSRKVADGAACPTAPAARAWHRGSGGSCREWAVRHASSLRPVCAAPICARPLPAASISCLCRSR